MRYTTPTSMRLVITARWRNLDGLARRLFLRHRLQLSLITLMSLGLDSLLLRELPHRGIRARLAPEGLRLERS